MAIPTKFIHIDWSGPVEWRDALNANAGKDYGLYQIYGGHVIYGSDRLLYIGKAGSQTFGVRLKQEKHWSDNHDADRLRVYLGRMAGDGRGSPNDKEWGTQIDLAERLLIYACVPAYNAQKNLGKLDADLHNVHVLNWGKIGALLPEVSGARWTSRFESMTSYHVFDVAEQAQRITA